MLRYSRVRNRRVVESKVRHFRRKRSQGEESPSRTRNEKMIEIGLSKRLKGGSDIVRHTRGHDDRNVRCSSYQHTFSILAESVQRITFLRER